MANTKSVQKRARQSAKRATVNRESKTRVKTARKAVVAAITSGDKQNALSKWHLLCSVADKAAKKGVIHKNSANRIKSLYGRRIAALS
ncbi:MAG: 30S ribosomal protein S20 [Verrucomicrobiales bacterium]|nr:30S ribosomal protein S20 [Verrucomicrobiales bacterium]MED5586574.1 30S ribosomal protein S20 [Verrucomicrobiota bacterium]